MRAITSKKELLKKLRKNNLVTDGVRFYLSDFHKSSVGKTVAHKVIDEVLVEQTNRPSWFEAAFKLKNKYERNGI